MVVKSSSPRPTKRAVPSVSGDSSRQIRFYYAQAVSRSPSGVLGDRRGVQVPPHCCNLYRALRGRKPLGGFVSIRVSRIKGAKE
jgi:hypothetical protein